MSLKTLLTGPVNKTFPVYSVPYPYLITSAAAKVDLLELFIKNYFCKSQGWVYKEWRNVLKEKSAHHLDVLHSFIGLYAYQCQTLLTHIKLHLYG